MLKMLTTGLQHLGIGVSDLNASVKFYEALGFEVIHRKKVMHNDTPVECAFINLQGFVIELFLLEDEGLEEMKKRKDGHIDHFAINVTDVKRVFDIINAHGFKCIDKKLQFIDFFDKGVKFFRINGPDNEVIEFNEKL